MSNLASLKTKQNLSWSLYVEKSHNSPPKLQYILLYDKHINHASDCTPKV